MMNVRALLSKKAGISLGLGIFIVIIFQILIASDSIPESTYSGDNNIIPEVMSKNPFQVYKINTECELITAILNEEFSIPITALSKSFPDEANEAQQILDEIQVNNGVATPEQESKIKALFYIMMMKYFSINPDLKDSLIALTEHSPYSLAGIDRLNHMIPEGCDLDEFKRYG